MTKEYDKKFTAINICLAFALNGGENFNFEAYAADKKRVEENKLEIVKAKQLLRVNGYTVEFKE